MTDELRDAAYSLHASLEHFSWFRSVGMGLVDGSEGLIVYVSRDNRLVRQHIPVCWRGFPVSPRRMARMIP